MARYSTTRDRILAAEKVTDHVITYGAFPGKINFRMIVAIVLALAVAAYVIACVINYAGNLDSVARMCAEVFSNPGTDAIPASCR